MAFFEMMFKSEALAVSVSVNVIIPETAKRTSGEKTYKTLYLLHGLSDDHTVWMRRTAIERYAADKGIAVVMPAVGRSWYTDTAYGAKYFTFVADELPRTVRGFFKGMSDKREDNLIAGLSMGGYGAVKIALSRPEAFGYCASLSGALDIPSREGRPEFVDEWRGIFGFDFEGPSALKGTKHDVFALAEKVKAEGKEFPKLFIWCGESDFLLPDNERFDAYLTELGVDHVYNKSEGDHTWRWWDMHIQNALNYFLP